MAVPIGISVGDFIATIKLFKDIANALDEHGGAQSDYQNTVRNLETVQALLSRLESYHSASGQTTQINAIRAQAQAIHADVQTFLRNVQKFKKSLGSGVPTSKRHGIVDKLKWSRKQAKKVAKLSTSVDVGLRNIQVLLDLDLSERGDLALQHHKNAANHLSSLPTRQELLSSASQTVDETRAVERSVDSRIDRAEATLLLRLDSLEQRAQKANDDIAKTYDLQDLRAYIDDRLSSAGPSAANTAASARVVLTLTLPQLRLSKQDVARLLGRLSGELEAVLQALSIWTGTMLAFFVLVVPQLLLLQRTLRRLPAAISLALHDNMTFEDALGRLHSLQFQQFRHWRVFESSLHCIFAETPGSQKISKGHFVLIPDDQPAVALTAANYSTLVRPGYAFKMSMAMKKLTAQASRCPKGCSGNVEKVSVLELRCKICNLQYLTGLLGGNAELGSQKTGAQSQSPEAAVSKYGVAVGTDLAKNTARAKTSASGETPSLDPRNSALIRWRPPAYDPRDLIDRWERANELAEMKFFKRIHIKVIEPETGRYLPGYFEKFFRIERELGRGGRGVVLLVEHLDDGVALGHFACKRVPIGDNHAWLEKIRIEVELLTRLSHQNLVSYRHIWLEDFQLNVFAPSVPCAFILQQYCNGGDLHEYVCLRAETTTQELKERIRRRSRGLPGLPRSRLLRSLQSAQRLHFEEILSFFKDITAGIRHLHHNGYVHRDLKPTNCLLHTVGKEMRVLVSDFGEVQYDSPTQEFLGVTGIISYYAPEALRQLPSGGPFYTHTTKSDIFSLGMILYFLCFADLPYNSANVYDEESVLLEPLTVEILAWPGFGDGDEEKKRRPDLPGQLFKLLKHLLSVGPDDRPTADEVHDLLDIGSGWRLSLNSSWQGNF